MPLAKIDRIRFQTIKNSIRNCPEKTNSAIARRHRVSPQTVSRIRRSTSLKGYKKNLILDHRKGSLDDFPLYYEELPSTSKRLGDMFFDYLEVMAGHIKSFIVRSVNKLKTHNGR